MAGIFKASDIVLAAQEIETRGEAFYQKLEDATADDKAREVFAFLKKEEANHREIFRAMAERLEPVEMPAWSNEGEYLTYMNAMLDSHALFNKDAGVNADMTREQGIRMAMQFEKDTMLFFMEMMQFVPVAEQEHLQRCVDEERKHLKTLTGLL